MKKQFKGAVDFEHPANGMDHCSECEYFQEPKSCERVRGLIRPGDWCRLWKKAEHAVA